MSAESKTQGGWLSCWKSWRMYIKQKGGLDMDELMECLNKLNGIDRYKVLVYARVLVKIQEEKSTARV